MQCIFQILRLAMGRQWEMKWIRWLIGSCKIDCNKISSVSGKIDERILFY